MFDVLRKLFKLLKHGVNIFLFLKKRRLGVILLHIIDCLFSLSCWYGSPYQHLLAVTVMI